MKVTENEYEVGDWMVHSHYGLGQVRKLEEMPVGGSQRPCYRVRTDEGVFWLPADNADNERVRPLASPKQIQYALEILKRPAKRMASKYQVRYKRIQEERHDGDLTTDLRLLRDLNLRQHRKGLSMTEQEAFDAIANRFLKEWSLSKGIKVQVARQKLNRFLRESWKRAKEGQDKKLIKTV